MKNRYYIIIEAVISMVLISCSPEPSKDVCIGCPLDNTFTEWFESEEREENGIKTEEVHHYYCGSEIYADEGYIDLYDRSNGNEYIGKLQKSTDGTFASVFLEKYQQEVLLYDFSWQIGDMLTYQCYKVQTGELTTHQVVITQIDSIPVTVEWSAPEGDITSYKMTPVVYVNDSLLLAKDIGNLQGYWSHAFLDLQTKDIKISYMDTYYSHLKPIPTEMDLTGSFLYDKSINQWYRIMKNRLYYTKP